MSNKNLNAKINVHPATVSSRATIADNDNVNTAFGKVNKVIEDLKTVAFNGSYNDLSNKPTNLSEFTNDCGYLTANDIRTEVANVTPSFNAQTITPSSNADYISSVNVAAIPISTEPNAGGGLTVTIG